MDANVKDKSGNSILNFVLLQDEKNFEILKYLIEIKGNVNLKDNLGHTPFMNALRFKGSSIEIIELLINSKADANITNYATERYFFF